ncbi:MAG: hypothetical protein KGN79_11645 [Acidobacteriota bacterium]|nr:hypothetical protein [Acidobacteriota bacterium]
MLANVAEKVAPVQETVRNMASIPPAVADAVQDGIRTVKRSIRHGRDVAEDAIDETQRQIKRRPFQAICASFLVGAATGGLTVWALFRRR